MARCAPWSSTRPAARCGPSPSWPTRSPAPARRSWDVRACGVCRTDLHIVDGELRAPRLPLVPGHQIVGTVLATGDDAELDAGARVGIPWLGWTCGACRFCLSGRENLCVRARFTGLDVDGGYAHSHRGRCALLLRRARGLRRPRGRAAAVRRPDRPPGAADGGRRRAPRALRLRCGRAHRLPGRPPRGPARVRLHARRRHRGAGLRAVAGLRVGGRCAGPGA